MYWLKCLTCVTQALSKFVRICRGSSWTWCWLCYWISILQRHSGQHYWDCARADGMDLHWPEHEWIHAGHMDELHQIRVWQFAFYCFTMFWFCLCHILTLQWTLVNIQANLGLAVWYIICCIHLFSPVWWSIIWQTNIFQIPLNAILSCLVGCYECSFCQYFMIMDCCAAGVWHSTANKKKTVPLIVKNLNLTAKCLTETRTQWISVISNKEQSTCTCSCTTI